MALSEIREEHDNGTLFYFLGWYLGEYYSRETITERIDAVLTYADSDTAYAILDHVAHMPMPYGAYGGNQKHWNELSKHMRGRDYETKAAVLVFSALQNQEPLVLTKNQRAWFDNPEAAQEGVDDFLAWKKDFVYADGWDYKDTLGQNNYDTKRVYTMYENTSVNADKVLLRMEAIALFGAKYSILASSYCYTAHAVVNDYDVYDYLKGDDLHGFAYLMNQRRLAGTYESNLIKLAMIRENMGERFLTERPQDLTAEECYRLADRMDNIIPSRAAAWRRLNGSDNQWKLDDQWMRAYFEAAQQGEMYVGEGVDRKLNSYMSPFSDYKNYTPDYDLLLWIKDIMVDAPEHVDTFTGDTALAGGTALDLDDMEL